MIRQELGLIRNQAYEEIKENLSAKMAARIVAATVRLQEGSELDLVTTYFQDGVGLNDFNSGILDTIVSTLSSKQCIIGGDFNMHKEKLGDKGFYGMSGLQPFAPDNPTCKGNKGTFSTIDYFIVSPALGLVVDKVRTEDGEFHPHRPVTMTMRQDFGQVWVKSWARPKAMNKQPVIGPMQEIGTKELNDLKTRAEHLKNEARYLTDAQVQQRLSRIYKEWAYHYEEEISRKTGTTMPAKSSRRGNMPKQVWKY